MPLNRLVSLEAELAQKAMDLRKKKLEAGKMMYIGCGAGGTTAKALDLEIGHVAVAFSSSIWPIPVVLSVSRRSMLENSPALWDDLVSEAIKSL